MTNLTIPGQEPPVGEPTTPQAGPDASMTRTGPEAKEQGPINFVREVSIKYRGPRRAITSVRMAQDVAAFIRKVLPDNAREHFVALYLDGSHSIVAFSITSTGTVNNCLVHAREVFQPAILVGAVAVAVGHNHPSGQCSPSDPDDRVTANLKEAGVLLGIALLDHVIVCEDAFYSYSERGLL
jgi:DNA repair protein RadC